MGYISCLEGAADIWLMPLAPSNMLLYVCATLGSVASQSPPSYFTVMTKYLLTLQNACGLVMRRVY